MSYRRGPVIVPSSDDTSAASNGAVTLASVRPLIHFMTVRVDSIICESPNDTLQRLLERGQLFGFKLEYKVPNNARGNQVLNREVVVNAAGYNSSEIVFKHKKVYSIDLDPDLVNKWDSSSIHLALHMVTARSERHPDAKQTVLRSIARTTVPLSDLLVPPFCISRDFHMVGLDFDGVVSVAIELGTRNVLLSEKLKDLRTSDLDATFNVRERVPRRSGVRSRSQSRCRSCSSADENRSPSPEALLPPSRRIPNHHNSLPPARRLSASRPRIPDPLPHERFVLPQSHHSAPAPLRERQQPAAAADPFQRPSSSTASEESDSVFSSAQGQHEARSTSRSSQPGRGSVELEVTLHEATNLPFVTDQRGHMVPPRAFIQMLGRGEQVQSTVAAPSRNPKWNWTGTFVFSLERGNLLIKVLHRTEDDRIESLGMVTINSPLRSFDYTEFELTPLVNNASGLSTITLSLVVSRRAPSRVEIGRPTVADRFLNTASRSSRASGSTRSDEGSVVQWVGSVRHPRLRLMTDRQSVSRSPPLPTPSRRNWHEDTSHKLHDNLNDLQNAIRQLR